MTDRPPGGAREAIAVGRRVRVPFHELRFSFARSSGPGGQNVNKVATKAVLRFDVRHSPSLPPDVRERLERMQRRRITGRGDLVVSSQRYRERSRNVEDCLQKLEAMLAEAARRPTPRRATRPTRAAKARRLQEKRRAGEKKRRRKRPGRAGDLD